MADKFRVGQKVRLLPCTNPELNKHLTGMVATIVYKHLRDGYWRIDLTSPNGTPCNYHESNMKPIYDGDEKSSWRECAWKPQTEPKPISTITK